MKALIIIAHGSKKQSSNDEFLQMVENIREKNSYDFTKASFLELAEPNIFSVVKELILENVEKIDIYPFFLNSGKHVLIDIPQIVQSLKNDYPDLEFNLLSHFGKSKNVEQIILNDLIQE